MSKTSRSSHPLLDRFGSNAPYVGLEKIKSLIEKGQKQDIFSYLLYVLIFPGAIWIYFKIRRIIKSQKNIDSFSNLVEQEPILIVLATLAYGFMWRHLFPVVVSCWNLFYQHYSWQEFLTSLAQWNTLQALVVFTFNFFLTKFAISSFVLTPAFEDRYQFLKLLAKARYEKPIVQAEAVNDMIRGKAEMMQNLIAQTFTAMSATGELDAETARKMIDIVKNSCNEIISDDSYEPKFNIGEAHLEPENFPILEEKLDDEPWE